uniref:Chitin-binding type-2 domain-containing protein n=1 Tax=Anopheles culicifacies TaxID=139723 RepID=A0A182ML14_9DIPT
MVTPIHRFQTVDCSRPHIHRQQPSQQQQPHPQSQTNPSVPGTHYSSTSSHQSSAHQPTHHSHQSHADPQQHRHHPHHPHHNQSTPQQQSQPNNQQQQQVHQVQLHLSGQYNSPSSILPAPTPYSQQSPNLHQSPSPNALNYHVPVSMNHIYSASTQSSGADIEGISNVGQQIQPHVGHDAQLLPAHLKCGMWASLALATVFVAGAKFYFDHQGTGVEVLIFCAFSATFFLAACTVSLWRRPRDIQISSNNIISDTISNAEQSSLQIKEIHCHGTKITGTKSMCDQHLRNGEMQEGVPSPSSCPPTGIHLIGNPADCISFFVCLNGEKSDEATNCAPDLIFDITDSGLYNTVDAQRNPCLGIPDGMFVNDFTSCESYFLCLGGVSTQAQCPPGFYFNEAQQLCDFPQNVFCHVCNQQTGVQLFPHPTNCDQFITCSNGISFVGNCKPGETYDVALQACKSEMRVDCERLRCPEVDNPNVVVFIPGFQSCDEYFLCQAGTPIQRFCAPGLHWNREVERCDFPELAQCPGKTSYSRGEDGKTFDQLDNGVGYLVHRVLELELVLE